MASAEKLVRFMLLVNRLADLDRRGWTCRGLPYESIASHVMKTAVLSLSLCEFVEEPVDVEKVLKMALIHDLAEAVTGDFDAYAIDIVGEDEKLSFESKVMEKVLELSPLDEDAYLALWNELLEGKTLEAGVVRLADKLDGLIRTYLYYLLGYPKETFDEFLKSFEGMEVHPKLEPLRREFLKFFYGAFRSTRS